MKKIIIIFSVIILIGTFFFMKKFIFVSEKDRVKRTIKTAVKAINDKDYHKFMKQFSIEYRDEYGNTWGTLFFYLKNILKNYQEVSVSVSNLDIKIEDKIALVKLFGKGKAEDSYGEVIREAGRFIVKLKKEAGRWKIIWIEEDKYRFD